MPEHSALADVLILLVAAVIAVPIFQRLKVGPVLGYLVAGIIIGPGALGLVSAGEEIELLAELGVVFLLFAIGLELKLQRLWVMRRMVFGLGSLQVLISGAVLGGAALGFGLSIEAAIVAGFGLALSSTAVVLQILYDRNELTTHAGRTTFSILLLQDLAVVPLLALIPILAGDGPSVPAAVGMAAAQAMGVLLLIVLLGRFLLRPLLRLIAASNSMEIFSAAAVLVVLGTSWATAEVGLSMALGAFLAGLMLAETEFRHQIEADIQPFRGFLLGLFFITVGMSIDPAALWRNASTVVAIVIGLLAIKSVIIYALVRLFRLGRRVSVHSGLLLAQGGEFGFVLFALARNEGIIDAELATILMLAVSITMFMTPFLAIAASKLAAKIGEKQTVEPITLDEQTELSGHVIIAGFGRVGQTIANMLQEEGIPYLALETRAEQVAQGRDRGHPVYFADAAHPEVLRAAGANAARAVVVTMDDPGRAERTVGLLHQTFPSLEIFARARDQHHGARLRAAGASVALPETVEASLQLGATLLRSTGAAPLEIERLLEEYRRDDYAALDVLTKKGKAKAAD